MNKQPQLFTFFSFKGGVGRSMALLNLAYGLVAKGRNVLVLDMDLEAPGLSGFMSRENEIPDFPRHDMLDLLQWAKETAEYVTEEAPLDPNALPPLMDYVVRVSPEKLENLPHKNCELGRLDVIPIEINRSYYERLPAVAVANMDRQTLLRVGSLLRAWLTSRRFLLDIPDYYGPMPEEERVAHYDYVLIDSRTGSTEVGGLCIGPLSDQLVVLCGLNDQNIEDTRHFLIEVGVLTPQSDPPRKLGKLTLFVASPVPTGEMTLKSARLARMKERLGPIAIELTYHPQMALMETVFVRDYPDEDLTTRYRKLLEQLMVRADDRSEFDPSLLQPLLNQRTLTPETRVVIHSLLRPASGSDLATMLFFVVHQIDLELVTTDEDFRLLDHICRAVAHGDSSWQFTVFGLWSDVLIRWSQCSVDAGLADQRFAEAIDRIDRVITSPEISLNQRAQALFNRGVRFAKRNEIERAIADYTAVIGLPDSPAEYKSKALVNRGAQFGQRNEIERAIADYTAVIEMPDAPADQKARAHFNRGVKLFQQNAVERAIADYTAVIGMADASAELKSNSLVNRGGTFVQLNQVERAIADFTRAIELPDAPAEQKSAGYFNRGVMFGQRNEIERAIADYTAVIEMPDAPVDRKANALFNRGLAFGQRNEIEPSIADYTAVIEMPDAPAELKAKALLNRGVSFAQRNEFEQAIADYAAVMEMPDAPAELNASALFNRGVKYSDQKEVERAIADYTEVIEMPDAPPELKAKSLNSRGALFSERNQVKQAIADFTSVIEMAHAPAELKADALIARGFNFGNQNEFERAIADYTSAIELPDSTHEQKADALCRRGWRSYSSDRFSEAIADLRQAVLLDPGNVRARGNLAVALLVSGEESEALATYDAAIDLADSELLADFEQDLSDAIAKHGTLAGADQVRTLIDARAAKLLESTAESAM